MSTNFTAFCRTHHSGFRSLECGLSHLKAHRFRPATSKPRLGMCSVRMTNFSRPMAQAGWQEVHLSAICKSSHNPLTIDAGDGNAQSFIQMPAGRQRGLEFPERLTRSAGQKSSAWFQCVAVVVSRHRPNPQLSGGAPGSKQLQAKRTLADGSEGGYLSLRWAQPSGAFPCSYFRFETTIPRAAGVM